jgi:CHASE2 domain-containing sensor protein
MTNGSGAAAVLSAGVGSFTLAVVAIAADQSKAVKSLMNFYHPTGPLSGVTTTAIFVWLVLWIVLAWRWRDRNLAMSHVGAIALVFLVLSLLLTFPPIADLF